MLKSSVTRVTSKGQVTIPVQYRHILELQPGDLVKVFSTKRWENSD